jgi:hypothetical protein
MIADWIEIAIGGDAVNFVPPLFSGLRAASQAVCPVLASRGHESSGAFHRSAGA